MRRAIIVCLLFLEQAVEAAVVKGPYLQDARIDGMTICAETDTSAVCRVEYGTGFSRSVTMVSSDKHHEVKIRGLEPSTCYPYRLVCGGVPAGESYFCTAPQAHEPFDFVILGDTRSNHAAHQKMINLVAAEQVDFYANTGDLVGNGALEEDWNYFFQIEGELMKRLPLYPTIGNHDTELGLYTIYQRLFAPPVESSGRESYYSFVYGNTLFAVVDNQASLTWGIGLDADQRNWLLATLKNAPRHVHHKIILVHECLYSSKAGRSGDWVLRWMKGDLKAAGLSLFICGHDHYYERGETDDATPYIISGGGGAPLYATDNPTEGRVVSVSYPPHTIYYSKSMFHYLRGEVRGRWLRICAKDENGFTFDCLELGEPPRPDGGVEDGSDADAGDNDQDENDGGDFADAEDQTQTCACGDEPEAPVCGEDGKTYRNLCELDCAQVGKSHDGPCSTDPCADCPPDSFPVCGNDGRTYTNACFLKCAGVDLAHTGPCTSEDCLNCPDETMEVCGKDGRTYRNQCLLECQGAEKAHDGPCLRPTSSCRCGQAPGIGMSLLLVFLPLLRRGHRGHRGGKR